MGFVWKYSKQAMGPRQWRLMIAVTRRRYGDGEDAWWDEEITASYLNGDHAGQSIHPYHDFLPSYDETSADLERAQYADVRVPLMTDEHIRREKVIFVVPVSEGELIALMKDGHTSRYILVYGEIVTLDADFAPVVQQYINETLSIEWLLAQENMGE